jgi:PilZ domain
VEASPFNELRSVQRNPGDTIGPLQLRAESLSLMASVRDISIQGIGLVATQSFDSGTSFMIEAGPSGKSLPAELKTTVRHARMLEDGKWLLGCSFSRILTMKDFDVLG